MTSAQWNGSSPSERTAAINEAADFYELLDIVDMAYEDMTPKQQLHVDHLPATL